MESEEGERDQVMERNGVTYISLPSEIQRKRGTINPQNKDRNVSNGVFWQNMSPVETGVVSEIIKTNILKNMTSQVCHSQHR